jgi:hypothetical protein
VLNIRIFKGPHKFPGNPKNYLTDYNELFLGGQYQFRVEKEKLQKLARKSLMKASNNSIFPAPANSLALIS